MLATLILGPLLLLALPGQVSVRITRWIVAHLTPQPEERVHPGNHNDAIERAHLARYNFAKPYCAGQRVADIASGTGYGMKILATVAQSVEGYDRESLGQRYVIDLEKQSWSENYDVIVSFETIEHLANPDFFLANAARSAPLLILSTPTGEKPGANPFHKQTWSAGEVKALLEKRYRCEYRCQIDQVIGPDQEPCPTLVAVCQATHDGAPSSGPIAPPGASENSRPVRK